MTENCIATAWAGAIRTAVTSPRLAGVPPQYREAQLLALVSSIECLDHPRPDPVAMSLLDELRELARDAASDDQARAHRTRFG